MTWVIGASTLFGYGFMISDVCVSWRDGYREDCLQKIYPLGNCIFGGFAGSVELGFLLLQDLRNFLKLPEEEAKNCGWHPDWVAENWCLRARKIFVEAPKELQELRCEIILVGASPNEDIGIPGFARIYIVVLKDPNFEPQIVKNGNKILSIGSGAGVEIYKEALKKLSGDYGFSLMQAEVGTQGGYGGIILDHLSEVIKKAPEEGISKHLQIAIIRRGQYSLGNNDTTIFLHSGEKIDIKMPPLAKSYPEFLALSKKYSRGAIC